jgi:hypothetical protein
MFFLNAKKPPKGQGDKDMSPIYLYLAISNIYSPH